MNEQKFSGKGNVYAKGRPGYPDELFEALEARGVLTGSMVAADIGAGTGIFTELLARHAARVLAVEPNDDMRSQAALALKDAANVTLLAGTAEHTGVADGSVQLVCAAQAFHWFDRGAFLAECRRMLTPDGYVMLVWNDRDFSSGVLKANAEVNRRFCPGFHGSSNGMDMTVGGLRDFFHGKIEEMQFAHDYLYDREMFLTRNLSSSYTPKEGEAGYTEYVAALGDVFDRFSEDGHVRYPYVTKCFLGKV